MKENKIEEFEQHLQAVYDLSIELAENEVIRKGEEQRVENEAIRGKISEELAKLLSLYKQALTKK